MYPRPTTPQVCIGLFNRDETVAGPVYGLIDHWDTDWLESIDHVTSPLDVVEAMESFLSRCLAGTTSAAPVAKGYIRYNATAQKVPGIDQQFPVTQ